MTAKRRLVPLTELKELFDFLRQEGFDPAACCVDIRADGVAVSPPATTPGNAYDAWKAKDKNRDRPARSQ